MNIMPEWGTEKGRMSAEAVKTELLAAALLIGWAFFINRNFRISGLYMDDLYTWSCWGEQSFFEYVFPAASSRCRFVYWFASWIELALIGTHLNWIVPINIALNAGLAYLLYRFSARLADSRGVGMLSGMMFLISHFSYYQIGQLLGLMETMGLFFALMQCLQLWRFLNEKRRERDFYLSLLCYFLNCFTHERYMALLPMFFFCLIWKREKDRKKYLSAALVFLLVLALRFLLIGSLSPAGTGGTQLADTFTARGAAVNFLVELLYCAGINAGPEHLSGLPWSATPFSVKLLVLLRAVLLAAFLAMVLAELLRGKSCGKRGGRALGDFLLVTGFAIGCAAASSVTIRVEMRWVYAVYTFMLLQISVLFGARKRLSRQRNADPREKDRYRISDSFPFLLLCAAALAAAAIQLSYRGRSGRIYLFPNQERYNSLADETYGRYGAEILGKEIIVIGNSYEMSEFTAETFFKTFDPKRDGQGTSLRHVEKLTDFGQLSEQMLVLEEEPERNAFRDVTEAVRRMKLEAETGYYRDGWMDERAKIYLLTGRTGEIRMRCMYPGNLRGDEYFELRMNGGETRRFALRENISEYAIQAEPRQIAALEFSTSFYVEDAAEQRGDGRLAMIVSFAAD